MINFKREYIGLEQDRLLYPVSFTDKAKCNVYGRKKFITEAGEVQLSAHVFLISKDFWTFNAGQLDFTNYPNGIWNDYISIDIVEKDEYTAPSINFGSMGDITPENLQGLSDYISKHLSDLEKRIVEDYLFIDEGVSENIELPNLPENHFWVRKNGVIVGVNLDYLKADYEHLKNELWKNYESFNEKLQAALKKYYDDLELQMNNFFKDLIEKIREEAEKQLGLIAGAGGGLLHKIDQANHGFIFDPIVYENGVWKKATTTSGVDGIGVVISANTFFFLEAGEIEVPQGATDKDGQPLLDDEYYYMNEDGGTGFQKEEPVWFYQPLFHTRTYKGKLLANVHIDTMEDLRGQIVDTESGRTHGIALWGDIVPKFDTIEKLQKAFWLKEGEVVEVLGYYSAGDGAGHKRIIKAEDDGSGVQVANNLWACIVHNGEVNVSWFGAKGDGVTDDTEIVQKCLDYCYAKKIKCYLQNSAKYIISKTITIHENYGFDGNSSIFIRENNSSLSEMIIIEASNIANKSFCGNFRIIGLKTGYYDGPIKSDALITDLKKLCDENVIGLTIKGSYSKIENVHITNCYKAIVLFDKNTYICNFENIAVRHNYIGVYSNIDGGYNAGENFKFNNCIFGNNIEFINIKAMGFTFSNCSIDYNLYFTKNTTTSLGSVSSGNINFIGCWIENNDNTQDNVGVYCNCQDSQIFFTNCEIIYDSSKGSFIKNTGTVALSSFNSCNITIFNSTLESAFSQCDRLITKNCQAFTKYSAFTFKHKNMNMILDGNLTDTHRMFSAVEGANIKKEDAGLRVTGSTYISAECLIKIKRVGDVAPVFYFDFSDSENLRVIIKYIYDNEIVSSQTGYIYKPQLLYQLRQNVIFDSIEISIKKEGTNNNFLLKGVYAYEW